MTDSGGRRRRLIKTRLVNVARRTALSAYYRVEASVAQLQPTPCLPPAAVRERLRQSVPVLERILVENIIPFWLARVVDDVNGGYHLNHDGEGRSMGSAPKVMIAQARTLWFFSRLAGTRWASPAAVQAARHGYDYLRNSLWDSAFGGFYWEVSDEGVPTKPHKHLLAQMYGLFALSEYARAMVDESARELAGEVFRVFDEHAHDHVHGGYTEMLGCDWAPLDGIEGYFAKNPRIKTVASQLHVLEALTRYHALEPQAVVQSRLAEMLSLLTVTTLRRDAPVGPPHYRPDWTPVGRPGRSRHEYGHELKRAWLVGEGGAAAGLPPALLLGMIVSVVDEVVRFGYDRRAGGFYLSGPLGRPADRREKHWWVEAEALLCCLYVYKLTGDPKYARLFLGTLEWVATRQVDWTNGDWHASVDGQGRPSGSKASPWKDPYHNGRAMVACIEAIEAMPEQGVRTAGQKPGRGA